MHLNMSYVELRNMPVRYRRWYLERLTTYFREQAESHRKASEAVKAKRKAGR